MGYTCPEHVFLHADHISKIYPGTKALDDVSFDLLRGKVNVLIGENGAGKSTLMKMIAGIEHPSEGKMYIGDQEVSFKDTTEARKHGIHLIWVTHNLMCPEDGTRRDMRTEINRYMRTVFREEPLDPSLEDFDDSKSW